MNAPNDEDMKILMKMMGLTTPAKVAEALLRTATPEVSAEWRAYRNTKRNCATAAQFTKHIDQFLSRQNRS